jgi:hypothetical protein
VAVIRDPVTFQVYYLRCLNRDHCQNMRNTEVFEEVACGWIDRRKYPPLVNSVNKDHVSWYLT